MRVDEYSQWVNLGKDRPTHLQFNGYIKDVLQRCRAIIYEGLEVVGLEASGGKWTVTARVVADDETHAFPGFDAVVVTGAGLEWIAAGHMNRQKDKLMKLMQ